MIQAFESMRRHEAAKGVLAADEVEHFRKQAGEFIEAVHAIQLRGLGGAAPALH